MKAILLAAAALALGAATADAAPKAHARGGALVGPEQPIPYARLGAYAKASAKARATQDWWAGSAFPASAAAVDTAATASAHVAAAPSATSPAAPTPR